MNVNTVLPYEEFIIAFIIIFIVSIIIGALAYKYKLQQKLDMQDGLTRLTAPNWMLVTFSLILFVSLIIDLGIVFLYYSTNSSNPLAFYLIGMICFIFMLISIVMLAFLLLSYVAYNDKTINVYRLFKKSRVYRYKDIKYYSYSNDSGIKLYGKDKIIIYSVDPFLLGIKDFVNQLNKKGINKIDRSIR